VNSLLSLIPYVRRHRRILLLGILCLVLSDTFQMAGPWLLKLAVDGLEKGIARDRLALFAGLVVGVALVSGVFRYGMRRLMIGTSREIEYEIRRDYFARLTGLSHGFFNRTPTGDLMSRATNDLNAVRMVLGPGIMYSVNTTVTLAAALTLMILLSWKLTAISLIPMPIISLFMYRYGQAVHNRFESVQDQYGTITARAQEFLSGIRVVRAYAQEPWVEDDFRKHNQEYFSRYMHLVRLNALMHPAIGFLAGSAIVLVLLFGGIMVIHERITLGSFVAFFAYLNMLIWPMVALGWVVALFQRGAASMKRMNAVLAADAEVADPPRHEPPLVLPTRAPGIAFRNVEFTYPTRPGSPVLRGIDIEIRPGETLGIAGRTGTGKTTLVNLVPRLFDPDRGQVLLGGRDLRDIPVGDLRAAIGYVPQEAFLFSRSLAQNIGFGRPDASDEEVRWAADLARLTSDVADFPKGYETMVGERGVTLSGGQKQRAAIARALLRKPRILILDDVLAAVDASTEEEILSGLARFMKDRTTLLVAHRVSTLQLADRIVVLGDGAVVEEGTHDALLAAGGPYAELARLQELERALEAAP